MFLRRWTSLGLLVFGVLAFGLGVWGWYLTNAPTDFADWADTLFRTFQLLTLQFPHEIAGPRWQLNVARFLVPSIALIQSYRLVLIAIRSPARLALLGVRFGHIIVVPGKGPVGRAMLREVQMHDLRAVAVAPDLLPMERSRMEDFRLPVVNADPYVDATWHQTRAERASLVVVSHGSDVDNLNIVVTVAEALRPYKRGEGPLLAVTLENDTLSEQVDLALDNAARRAGLRYRRLSVPDEAARAVFLDPPLPTRKCNREQACHIIILGVGTGFRAVLRHALTFGQDVGAEGPTITVLASEKDIAAETMLRPEAVPGFVATLRLMPCDLSVGLPDAILDVLVNDVPPPVLACVCLPDDAAVTTAIALSREVELRGWPDVQIAVHQTREDRFLRLLAAEGAADGQKRLRPFGGILPAGTLQRLQADSGNALARAVHEDYLETLRRQGRAGGTSVAWDDLAENYRHASRAAADHMAVKLAAIGAGIVPAATVGDFAFTAAEINALKRIEHRRWCAERLLRGWRFGRPRDNQRRLHPDLIPFEELDADGQEKDRASVLAIPAILARAGLSIQRQPCEPD